MGLLDQFAKLDMADMVADSERIAQERAAQQEIVAIRRRIVSDAVRAFATKHGYAYQELDSPNGGQTFIVEDIVLVVHEQMMLASKDVATVNPHDVLLQYFVYLVGLDRADSVWQCKIGTLLFLTFEGIRREYGRHIDFDFKKDSVIRMLFQA